MNNDDNPKSFRRHTRADGSIHYADPPAQSSPVSRDALANAIDSPTVEALAKVFSVRNQNLAKSISEQIVDILAPRFPAEAATPPGRIETLEAALREIAERSWHPANAPIGDIARAALAPEQDK
jgi:gamma-glutamyl-gamma-aminobutyrate hydrolase PuuD